MQKWRLVLVGLCAMASLWAVFAMSKNTASRTPSRPRGKPTLDVRSYDSGLFLSTAFVDHRSTPANIKVTAYFNKRYNGSSLYCKYHAWTVQATLHVVYKITWESGPEIWQAGYLLCPVASWPTLPTSVAVGGEHNATADVRLVVNSSLNLTRDSNGFFVCAKSLYGKVDAMRLIEWVELYLLLGVRHFYVYSLGIDGADAVRALDYYASSGTVTTIEDRSKRQIEAALPKFKELFAGRDATHASGAEPIVQLELLSVHDCLYRFGGAYEYMLVCDTDEVLMPKTEVTLSALAARVRAKHPDATSFLSHAAAYLTSFERPNASRSSYEEHTLRYTRRTDITWDGRKSFHSTSDTLLVDQHERQQPPSKGILVDADLAWVHHYRDSCKGFACNADVKLTDDGPSVMGRYEERLRSNVRRVALQLGLAT